MMNKFEFMTSNRIIFERDGLARIGALSKPFGRKALIVTGSRGEVAEKIRTYLEEVGLKSAHFKVTDEPGLDTTKVGLDLAREEKCDMVIACGGGSVIDSGKIIAAMLENEGEILSYLEVIGAGKTLSNPSAPCIAIPTTAGRGQKAQKKQASAYPSPR